MFDNYVYEGTTGFWDVGAKYDHWICSICGMSGWTLSKDGKCRESLEKHMQQQHNDCDWKIHDSGAGSKLRIFVGELRKNDAAWTYPCTPEQHEENMARGTTGNGGHVGMWICDVCGISDISYDPSKAYLDHCEAEHDGVHAKGKIVLGASEEDEGDDQDMVNHPSHYQSASGVECIDWIEEMLTPEEFKGYLKGQVLRYFWRYENKWDPVEDLEKGNWYYNKLLERARRQHNSDVAHTSEQHWRDATKYALNFIYGAEENADDAEIN